MCNYHEHECNQPGRYAVVGELGNVRVKHYPMEQGFWCRRHAMVIVRSLNRGKVK